MYPSWHTLQSLCVLLVTHNPVLCVHVVPHTLVYMCILSGTQSCFCVPLVAYFPVTVMPFVFVPEVAHFPLFVCHVGGIHLKFLWIWLVPCTVVLFSVLNYCRTLQFLVSFLSRVLFCFTFRLIRLLLCLNLNGLLTQMHSFVVRHNPQWVIIDSTSVTVW